MNKRIGYKFKSLVLQLLLIIIKWQLGAGSNTPNFNKLNQEVLNTIV